MEQKQQKRPVIGICGEDKPYPAIHAMMTQIRSAGGVPVFLGNHGSRDAHADFNKIDAIAFMGNKHDIDPRHYSETNNTHTKSEEMTDAGKSRANYEYALMQNAIDEKMPILGICGGMQRLNVLLEGTLTQHIPEIIADDKHNQKKFDIPSFSPVHPISLIADTTLAEIGASIPSAQCFYIPDDDPLRFEENSFHHQAVNKLGNGLRACAVADDTKPDGSKLIEAIEADPEGCYGNQFMLGVQWHPEYGASELGPAIARRVVTEAAEYAKAHQRTHDYRDILTENIKSTVSPDTLVHTVASQTLTK